MPKTPVAILAFNRPDYLQQTLLSLSLQCEEALSDREIHLFHDGGFNRISGKRYAEPSMIQRNISVFLKLFPDGFIHLQGNNLGIANHFNFIEQYFFETRAFDAAIFLEDDLVLSHQYLKVMELLIEESLQNEKIGCVAAYGDHKVPLERQLTNLNKIVPLDHRWGVAVPRRQWLKQRPLMREYLSLVSDVDYQGRNHHRIVDWFLSKGMCPFVTSQDGVKDAIMWETGAVGLMTYSCYGKYIGKVGVHFREDLYDKLRFDFTEICPEVPSRLAWPSDEQLEQMNLGKRAELRKNLTRVKELFPFYDKDA
jgi:hypothetical protein